MEGCPICHEPRATARRSPAGANVQDVICPSCGEFSITGTAAATDYSSVVPPLRLSAIIRNRFIDGEQVMISTATVPMLVESTRTQFDPIEKLDLLLERILRMSGTVFAGVQLAVDQDYGIIFADGPKEFGYYLTKALNLNFIESAGEGRLRLTLEGWKRLAELRMTKPKNNQCFVAMWFDHSLDEAWEDGLEAGISDSGYNPLRIDLQEHNEKICDRIIAEIRKSSLVVADFTGQRGGVYFESGFAYGLGIPLIRSCRQDELDTLHFDTRQYSHVAWTTPSELREKLRHRIEATHPITKLRAGS